MFRDRGYAVILTDNIIDAVLFLGNIGGAVVCLLITLCYCSLCHLKGLNATMLSSFGLLAGYWTFSLIMENISSAVATVCVCFAEKPLIFQVNKQTQYFPTFSLLFHCSLLLSLSLPLSCLSPSS
jgi:Plasma-membrane choline transporter